MRITLASRSESSRLGSEKHARGRLTGLVSARLHCAGLASSVRKLTSAPTPNPIVVRTRRTVTATGTISGAVAAQRIRSCSAPSWSGAEFAVVALRKSR